MGMSKTDQILASNTRGTQTKRKTGFLSPRARVLLLTLTTLLVLFVFLTQPQVRAALDGLWG
jgi:hypothetical protein